MCPLARENLSFFSIKIIFQRRKRRKGKKMKKKKK
jgi:hypothetical protein